MSSNLPPGVTTSMLPGNRPEDEYYEQVVDGLEFGEPIMSANELANLFNFIERSLQNAHSAGFSLGKQEAQMELAEKEAERYERDLGKWEEARYNSAALGECLDLLDKFYQDPPSGTVVPDGELISWMQDESLALLKKFHGDYFEEKED